MLTITETATTRLIEILAEENNPNLKVRVYVEGGGCSGLQYGFTFDDTQNPDDFEVPAGTLTVLVDSLSAQYLSGATVDYKDDLQGSRFSIDNPAAVTTCGCGSSFSI